MEIEFSQDDILNYFSKKGGKVFYTELVTHFKNALSNPDTQANARVLFKNYVNSVASVTNEGGKKYLILRPKYMKKLFPKTNQQETIDQQNNVIQSSNYETGHFETDLEKIKDFDKNNFKLINENVSSPSKDLVKNSTNFEKNENYGKSTSSINEQDQQVNKHCLNSDQNNRWPIYVNGNFKPLPTINEINMNEQNNLSSVSSFPPPRPPPRKKTNSFSDKINQNPPISPPTAIATSSQMIDQDVPSAVDRLECINTVRKEIQELSLTPGRVKEHAKNILNRLSLDATKMPNQISETNLLNGNSSNVGTSLNHITSQSSDTDSGSVHIIFDPLKKQWVLASSQCDYQQMLSLLKQDPELCSYKDYIYGYTALHWAAKFNKPEIIKLIAGNYKVNPNIKSSNGSTALHVAAQFKNKEIMDQLIYHYKADQDIRDNYGRKACQLLDQRKYYRLKGHKNKLNQFQNQAMLNGDPSNPNQNGSAANLDGQGGIKTNLRNKISHQSMLVRNTLRNTKAFKRRKSMNEKSKNKNQNQRRTLQESAKSQES